MAYGYEYLGPANIKKQPPPKRDDTLGPAFYSPKKRNGCLYERLRDQFPGYVRNDFPGRPSSIMVNLSKYNERRRRCKVVKEIRPGLKLLLEIQLFSCDMSHVTMKKALA